MRIRMMLNGFGVVALVILASISIGVFRATFNELNPDVNKIKMSHLTQFSAGTTIGDAFDRFFDNAEWSRRSTDGTTFVEVSGAGTFNDARVRARVIFELDGDMFYVNSIRINGSELNNYQKNQFLEYVFTSPLERSWNIFRDSNQR